jgi:hypothetical protein
VGEKWEQVKGKERGLMLGQIWVDAKDIPNPKN